MTMNSSKCHFLVAGYRFEEILAKIASKGKQESYSVNFLGITIDNQLEFDCRISLLYTTADRKLCAIAKIPH